MFFGKKKKYALPVSISVLLYLDIEVRNTCSDIRWHCSVSHMCCPHIPSETTLVQRVAVWFNEGLAWSACVLTPVLDSVLGFSRKYSL